MNGLASRGNIREPDEAIVAVVGGYHKPSVLIGPLSWYFVGVRRLNDGIGWAIRPLRRWRGRWRRVSWISFTAAFRQPLLEHSFFPVAQR